MQFSLSLQSPRHSETYNTTQRATITHCLPLLVQQGGHLYCFMLSALAGVVFTHLPWYQRSHTSQHIQNSAFMQCPPQLPQCVSPCSSSELSSINFLVLFISPSIDLYTKPKKISQSFSFLEWRKISFRLLIVTSLAVGMVHSKEFFSIHLHRFGICSHDPCLVYL